ncbi:hypothetical protein VA7868_02913 [Vibrio aerogenes CECT 7868]|uniref:Uncharacterized protein n=1 Tax=Vibrio aerogenes CECT 7868 TaxID=1216006 RepID=A0A1M5ZMU4_9VIBR|nr:hypothetical protein [Vibrio aerogenes]SHI25223.1 hypothetical protein VA7868_02913 [Vibrio aerogenes CECT 7868]
MSGIETLKNNYLPVINAQIQCINELSSEIRQERLALVYNESDYCIEKINAELSASDHTTILFQGKGRACHVFLNGYLASFMTK